MLALATFLGNQPEWDGALTYNLFTETVEIGLKLPSMVRAPRRELTDADILETTAYLQGNGFPKASKGMVLDALTFIARRHSHHPVRDYFNGLHWDGVSRVGKLFLQYFNAELPDASEAEERDRYVSYLEHISKCFMVGAVARIVQPGCKHDHAPVAVGHEGFMKSEAIRALCHDEAWFTDDISPNLIERDTKESLRGKWIDELAEMPHLKSELERLKAFVSRRVDRYRMPYGMLNQDHPRQNAFFGTCNGLEFLDVTGNRRFWPFTVAKQIHVTAIIADRDQLWAEAKQLYHQGVHWWLAPNIEAIAREQQARFLEDDLWEELIAQWTRSRTEPFSLKDLFAKDTGITPYREAAAVTKTDQMRAARCLTKMGFTKNVRLWRGDRTSWWQRKKTHTL
jgi:predicted P-loop ATPase